MPVYSLQISQPRSARFDELAESAWARTSTPLGDAAEDHRQTAYHVRHCGRRRGTTRAVAAARRAALLEALSRGPLLTVTAANLLGVTPSTAGHALAVLVAAGLVVRDWDAPGRARWRLA